ncbi:MAG TPA: DUF5658 family protein [Fimbriimonas sp.]|nr:DUF5658 family protein [Fimbriimonas sp.]
MRVVFPSRAILLLIGIGIADLISTAWLYHLGLIQERNPLMRFFLDRGEWSFILVKGATLFVAWIALAAYTKHNRQFVKRSCIVGSVAYMGLWLMGILMS